jgi:ribosomal-protein-alanine N-acetyltransferase
LRSVRIRKANSNDLAEIEYVEQLSFDEERYRRELLESFLYEDAFTTLVAMAENGIIGYATTYREESGMTCRVVSIGVLPEQRQKGIATSLMELIEEAAARSEVGKITLEVKVTNVPAINLYLKLGYKVRGIIEDYYGSGKDAFYMEKELAARKGGAGAKPNDATRTKASHSGLRPGPRIRTRK